MTLLALIIIAVLQLVLRSRQFSIREVSSVTVLLALFIVEFLFVHTTPHDATWPHGFVPLIQAFLTESAWPFPWYLALVVNLPALIMLWKLFRERPDSRSYLWWLASLLIWLGAQWLGDSLRQS